MITDLTFAGDFNVEYLPELPGGPLPARSFYPGVTTAGKDGLLLKISGGNASPWIGCFAFGAYELNGLIAAPEPGRLFVISKGAG